jgi:hypothetical protein
MAEMTDGHSTGGHQRSPPSSSIHHSHLLHRLLQRGGVDRQLSKALASCREDRVRDGGNNRRSPGPAHSARRLRIMNDVNLDHRRFVLTKQLVGVEIGLLYTALFDRDLTVERRRDVEKMIAPWICASTVSGLTTVPQSTAQCLRGSCAESLGPPCRAMQSEAAPKR